MTRKANNELEKSCTAAKMMQQERKLERKRAHKTVTKTKERHRLTLEEISNPQSHNKFRAEVRNYGQIIDQVEETTDLESVLSFCKKYFNQEEYCAVVLFVNNEEVIYIDYIRIMKEFFPELEKECLY